MSVKCVSVENAEEKILLENLPTDVLVHIFSYCDEVSLGRLSQQCQRLNEIIKNDCIWMARSKKAIVTNQLSQEIQERSMCKLSFREKCRVSVNWRKGRFKENVYFSQRTRYMPWLLMNHNYLWLSKGKNIFCYQRKRDGIHSRYPVQRLSGHSDDVCRFVEAEDMIISGGRDGALCAWNGYVGTLVMHQTFCHNSDINSVTVVNDTLVSGSRDGNLKLWRMQLSNNSCISLHTIDMEDRVWSTSLCPQGNLCAVGTAGDSHRYPLHLYDLQYGCKVMCHKEPYIYGAGVLDTVWESFHLFYSTGYDGYIRLWDTRVGTNVNTWEDPYDSSIYCLGIDHAYTILSGTCQHGRVQLWDKRQRHSLQKYFMAANHSSPVYSLAFDPCHLFAALDRSMNIMDFSGKKNSAVMYNI